MPDQPAIDIEPLLTWISREEICVNVVTPGLARKFHARLGLAGQAAERAEPAPPLIHFCLPSAPMMMRHVAPARPVQKFNTRV